MNMEQRQKVMQPIRKREILLSWALGHGEKDEAERLEREIRSLMAAFRPRTRPGPVAFFKACADGV